MNRREVHRIARYLVNQIGETAAPHAQENVDWSNACDDASSARDWMRIRSMIEALLIKRDTGEGLKKLAPPVAIGVTPIVPVGSCLKRGTTGTPRNAWGA